MTDVRTIPPYVQQFSSETIPWGFDVATLLDAGESISSSTPPTATLVEIGDEVDYSTTGLSGSPSVSDTVITQVVHALQAGARYRLAITFTIAANKQLTVAVEMACPF